MSSSPATADSASATATATATAAPGTAAASAPAPLCGTVLYIEDEPVSVQLVNVLLEAHPGVQLLHAATGAEGVRLARSARPDFVLLDMHLPDMGGLDVVRQLSDAIAARGLRVSILTGDRLTMDIIKAMSLGAYEYWVKPLGAAVFEAGLRRALTGTRPDPARTLGLPQR